MNENHFIHLAKTSKEEAFRYLVDNYSKLVYNTTLNLLRNKEDAEDLTQEVFTAVYLTMEKFEGKSKVSTWLYSIALNKSKEFLRSKTRKKRFGIFTVIEREDTHFVPEQIINFNHPGILLENKERASIFFEATDKLPENQRTAFILHKIEGVSYSEIAEIMDTSVSSVESLMFRAKKNLKEFLGEYYEQNKY